jgi:hypothetical protein
MGNDHSLSMSGWKTKVIAHRGENLKSIENQALTFEHAVQSFLDTLPENVDLLPYTFHHNAHGGADGKHYNRFSVMLMWKEYD